MNGNRLASWLLACLVLSAVVTTVFAQETALELRLRRDFGTGLGNNIEGRFSMRVSGPDDLSRVVFLIDGEPVAEQTEPPFIYQFETSDHPAGNHTLSAIGTTTGGTELRSNSITRNFLTGDQSNRSLLVIIVPIILLAVGGRFLVSWISKRGSKADPAAQAIDGPYGGTICPHCHKPFARHWWAPNLVTGKYDRCPHCHKWSFATRAHPDLLAASFQAMQQAEAEAEDQVNLGGDQGTDEEAKHKRLDDSRFDG